MILSYLLILRHLFDSFPEIVGFFLNLISDLLDHSVAFVNVSGNVGNLIGL